MSGGRLPVDASPQWVARGCVLLLVLVLVAPTAVSAVGGGATSLQAGTVSEPANGTTVISVQGFKIAGQQSSKKPARLVGVGPRGEVEWVYDGANDGIVWFYDVDPLANGSLLITGTRPGETVVTVWNPKTGETAWSETFDWEDTHDVDLINGDQLLVGNMRNYNETAERNDDQILLYDRSEEAVVWRWRFRDHGFDRSNGGRYSGDWTHVNDVDKVAEGEYLVSPRNFDQVFVINRTTGDISRRLGSDEEHDVLYEQHNPQYLRGEGGTPTMLVADSENDRVVEYARTNGSWTRTWTLTGNFNWPRDADRLPNGNTLVTDTLNHRVMEVTPDGEVVWEFYAPWGPYDAERIKLGDEPGGPTIREQNATGAATLTNSASLTPGSAGVTPARLLTETFANTPLSAQAAWLGERWAHVTPWIRPVWMGPWQFVQTLAAGLVLVGWAGAEAFHRRRRLREQVAAAIGD
ncbi:aryl-sulfate sulfotransferase [Halosegnis sp.]|uniref:aryl-sulfate sulfotransferase n=1 Tax=Halosegnis sp. TaxID=2864959 RepID=UPI0035D47970